MFRINTSLKKQLYVAVMILFVSSAVFISLLEVFFGYDDSQNKRQELKNVIKDFVITILVEKIYSLQDIQSAVDVLSKFQDIIFVAAKLESSPYLIRSEDNFSEWVNYVYEKWHGEDFEFVNEVYHSFEGNAFKIKNSIFRDDKISVIILKYDIYTEDPGSNPLEYKEVFLGNIVVLIHNNFLKEALRYVVQGLQQISIFIILMVILGTYFLNKHVISPLRQLQKRFYEVWRIRNNIDQSVYLPLSWYYKNEIWQLFNSFNAMYEVGSEFQRDILRVYHESPSLSFTLTAFGMVSNCSNYFLMYFSLLQKDVIGRSYLQFLPSESHKNFIQRIQEACSSKDIIYNFPLRIQSGGKGYHVLFNATPNIKADYVKDFLCVILDISKEIEIQNQLECVANTDSLLGIYNHYYLIGWLADNFKPDKPAFVFVLVAVDNYASLVDVFGRHFEEDFSYKLSMRIKELLLPNTVFGIFSPGNFYFIFDNNAVQEVYKLLENLYLKVHSRKLYVQGRDLQASLTLGGVFSRDVRENILRYAEGSLKYAQHKFLKLQMYTSEVDVYMQRIELIEEVFRKNIMDSGFYPVFQPLIDFRQSKIKGCETLSRLLHPEVGFIAPTEFIPLAEERGYIIALGYFILEEALKALKGWRETGNVEKDFYISVNLSIVQLQDSSLPVRLKSLLERYEIEAENLVLELTESLLMHDDQQNRFVVKSLFDLGCKLALDDFGTGYSSLSYLQSWPFDILKIDQSFVRQIPHNEKSIALLKNIGRIGGDLGMRVVCEGVETQEQVEFLLTQSNVELIQGYFYDRPLNKVDFQKKYFSS